MGKWKWNILIVLGYVRIQTIMVHIIDKKALGWNSTHLILAIYRMVGKPTIWVEIQHAPMTMWLWGWGFKPVLAQCVPHSCHEGTTHRRLNWRGFKKKSFIQRLSHPDQPVWKCRKSAKMGHFTPIFLKFEGVGGGLKRKTFQKISLHPIISYITTADSTCSFVSLDYVPPLLIVFTMMLWKI